MLFSLEPTRWPSMLRVPTKRSSRLRAGSGAGIWVECRCLPGCLLSFGSVQQWPQTRSHQTGVGATPGAPTSPAARWEAGVSYQTSWQSDRTSFVGPSREVLLIYEAEATFQRYPSGSLKSPKYPHGEAA